MTTKYESIGKKAWRVDCHTDAGYFNFYAPAETISEAEKVTLDALEKAGIKGRIVKVEELAFRVLVTL